MRLNNRILAIGAAALVATGGLATAASAQQNAQTPRGWNYEIRDGKRVPKSNNRVTAADGSWREETRQGNCVTIKEGTPDGAVKTSRKCD